MTDRYHVSYAFQAHPTGIEKKDVRTGWGACDAFLFASINRGSAGEVDIMLISGDGATGERLRPGEVAQIAGAVIQDCAETPELDEDLRAIFRESLERIRALVANRKRENTH